MRPTVQAHGAESVISCFEQRLLQFAPPYLRELILFAVNTGLRCGDVFTLEWEDVDIEEKRLSIIMGKTRHRLEIPLNETAMEILTAKAAVKHGLRSSTIRRPATGFTT